MRNCYFSKSYKDISSAGNKAKTDIEKIMAENGFVNVGLSQSIDQNKIIGFAKTFTSVLKILFCLKKGDILVVQYPFKKYYKTVCRIAHFRKSKVVTIIHDLGSFRRKKLSVKKEIQRLSYSDVIIAHNDNMKKWLIDNGYTRPITTLNIFDYLSENTAPIVDKVTMEEPYGITYGGALNYRKNKFLYEMEPHLGAHKFYLYGGGFESDHIKNKDKFKYMGFVYFEDLIADPKGDFGLVWDGESVESCQGTFGEYLQYNNPHKVSMYIRCHLPIIISDKAALADFVVNNNIGIKIDSLKNIQERLAQISIEEYTTMKQNTIRISKQLANGYYFMSSYKDAQELLKQD